VPSWTTTMPGSHIIAWSKLTGLVRSDTVGGVQRLLLTDDGQDYVSALLLNLKINGPLNRH
jgi:5-methylcytosine-specific restriction protein B